MKEEVLEFLEKAKKIAQDFMEQKIAVEKKYGGENIIAFIKTDDDAKKLTNEIILIIDDGILNIPLPEKNFR